MQKQGKTKQIAVKVCLLTVLGCAVFSQAAAAGENQKAPEVVAATAATPNAFNIPYNEQWQQQGCSREAWTQLNQSYNAKMNRYKAQAQVLDQQIINSIKTPSQLNLSSFNYLGCDLSSSLRSISDMARTVRDLFSVISSGNIKDKITQQLESKALGMLDNIARNVAQRACTIVTNTVNDRLNILKQSGNEATSVIDMVKNYDSVVTDRINQAVNQAADSATK